MYERSMTGTGWIFRGDGRRDLAVARAELQRRWPNEMAKRFSGGNATTITHVKPATAPIFPCRSFATSNPGAIERWETPGKGSEDGLPSGSRVGDVESRGRRAGQEVGRDGRRWSGSLETRTIKAAPESVAGRRFRLPCRKTPGFSRASSSAWSGNRRACSGR